MIEPYHFLVVETGTRLAALCQIKLCNKFFAGDVAGAMAMQKKYLDLTNALFCEVNPIPVKAAMAAMGWCEDYLRLPLVPMEDAHRQHLLNCMRDAGLEV